MRNGLDAYCDMAHRNVCGTVLNKLALPKVAAQKEVSVFRVCPSHLNGRRVLIYIVGTQWETEE